MPAAVAGSVAIVVLIALGVGRSLLDDGPTHPRPASVTTAPSQLEPLGTAAQLNAAFDTPEGRAALVHEFAPGSFGAKPSPAPLTPSDSDNVRPGPTTSDEVNCTGRGPC